MTRRDRRGGGGRASGLRSPEYQEELERLGQLRLEFPGTRAAETCGEVDGAERTAEGEDAAHLQGPGAPVARR